MKRAASKKKKVTPKRKKAAVKKRRPSSCRSARLGGPPESRDGALVEHRVRQACISSLLKGWFGGFADECPELWERRAYLQIVGMIYERLSTGGEDISTEELIKLSKALAENRRVEVRASARSTEENVDAGAEGELPDSFMKIVRRVYGTNFDTPNEPEPRQ